MSIINSYYPHEVQFCNFDIYRSDNDKIRGRVNIKPRNMFTAILLFGLYIPRTLTVDEAGNDLDCVFVENGKVVREVGLFETKYKYFVDIMD